MRHARAEDLDRLAPLLDRLRGFAALGERSRGVFYLRSKAFLHFHQDPAGLFADVRTGQDDGFERLRVDEAAGAQALVERIEAVLGPRG
jgi:hypothetical protein